MADKPEFVDMISEATRQSRRRIMPRMVDLAPAVKETSRLSHWPPDRWTQWRLENADAVEAQVLEIQELGLSASAIDCRIDRKSGARSGACFISRRRSHQ